MWKEMLLLAVAGGAGTLARYGTVSLFEHCFGRFLPWGTIAVNLLGCLLFGLIWSLAEERTVISPQSRFLLLTGFMGAFTTFSTFAFETGWYLQHSEWLLAALNLLGQLLGGIILVFVGLILGRCV